MTGHTVRETIKPLILDHLSRKEIQHIRDNEETIQTIRTLRREHPKMRSDLDIIQQHLDKPSTVRYGLKWLNNLIEQHNLRVELDVMEEDRKTQLAELRGQYGNGIVHRPSRLIGGIE